MGGRDGDGKVQMTAEEAVMHSQLSSAVKGSSHAQKNFLDRVERYSADLNAEVEKDHASWREYIDNYNKVASAKKKNAEEMPIDWIHPDDLTFKEVAAYFFEEEMRSKFTRISNTLFGYGTSTCCGLQRTSVTSKGRWKRHHFFCQIFSQRGRT